MATGIRPTFLQAALNKYVADQTDRIEAAIINRLKYIGEQFVVHARNNNTYRDETGNLRSSIGYVVVKNGEIIDDDFKELNAGTDKQTGTAKARQLCEDIAAENSRGFVLICVAGMQYAAAVESRGYDVISNSAINAKQELIKAITSLNRKLGK